MREVLSPRWTKEKKATGNGCQSKRLKLEASRVSHVDHGDALDDSLVLLVKSRVIQEQDDHDVTLDGATFSEDDAMTNYKEWISCQPKESTKMIAILMMDVFRMRFGLMDVSAAKESGLAVGFNEKTIRIWRNEYHQCHGDFTASGSGKHSRPYVLDDENCKKALSWLHDNVCQKNMPNLTAASFLFGSILSFCLI